MMPRWHDERVGFNSSRSYDFSRPDNRLEQVRFIHRFRLEKENPNAAMSDPVEPIVYWIDPATPDWLKPWIVKRRRRVAARVRECWASATRSSAASRRPRRGPGLLPLRCPELGHLLAALHGRQRHWWAGGRSPDRGDPEGRGQHVPQHHGPPEELVLHPSRTAR